VKVTPSLFSIDKFPSVGVACILRIVQTEKENIFQSGYWVIIQQNIGIICACLPTLRPVLPAGTKIWESLRYFKSSPRLKNSASGDTTEASVTVANRWHRRYNSLNSDKVDKMFFTSSTASGRPLDSESVLALNEIRVRTDMEVTR
jgi:hypothetical protein